MSAYVVVEFTVKDPDVYREKYGPNAGRTAKEYGGEVLANSNWEILHGDASLTSGALVRFPDHETAVKWYNSPEYQQLIDVRSLRPEIARIYLACRNQDRATTAKAELEAATGRSIFDIVLMDVADLGSVRAGLAAIDGSLDALVMNVGVIGDKKLMNLTADGVTTLFATNVLGHVVLLEGL